MRVLQTLALANLAMAPVRQAHALQQFGAWCEGIERPPACSLGLGKEPKTSGVGTMDGVSDSRCPIDCSDLLRCLGDDEILVLDCRRDEDWTAFDAHIPGALRMSWSEI